MHVRKSRKKMHGEKMKIKRIMEENQENHDKKKYGRKSRKQEGERK